jgi:hypothetical protein
MLLNFATKTYVDGCSLKKLNEIGLHYLKGRFLIDSISYVVLVIDTTGLVDSPVWGYFRLVVLFKLTQII